MLLVAPMATCFGPSHGLSTTSSAWMRWVPGPVRSAIRCSSWTWAPFAHRPLWREDARSTFPSQNVQNTPCSDHFLEVAMSKKCTPLWREAHFEVKMYKAHHARTTFGSCDVGKVHAVVARSTFRSQNVQNTTCSRRFWTFSRGRRKGLWTL